VPAEGVKPALPSAAAVPPRAWVVASSSYRWIRDVRRIESPAHRSTGHL